MIKLIFKFRTSDGNRFYWPYDVSKSLTIPIKVVRNINSRHLYHVFPCNDRMDKVFCNIFGEAFFFSNNLNDVKKAIERTVEEYHVLEIDRAFNTINTILQSII